VTTGLDMLEIGARQLNDWRLHELPDFLPFCQPGVPFNTPIFSLAATSSLSTTWAVPKPPVLSEDLSSEKTKRSHHCRSTWRWHGIPNVRTLCFSDAPPNPFFQSLDTWLHKRSSLAVVCASENVRKTPKTLRTSYCSIIFLQSQKF